MRMWKAPSEPTMDALIDGRTCFRKKGRSTWHITVRDTDSMTASVCGLRVETMTSPHPDPSSLQGRFAGDAATPSTVCRRRSRSAGRASVRAVILVCRA